MAEKFEDLFADGVTDLTSYRMGAYRERERIIKLLEEMRDTCFDTKTELGDHNGWTLQNAIALIKGDNK